MSRSTPSAKTREQRAAKVVLWIGIVVVVGLIAFVFNPFRREREEAFRTQDSQRTLPDGARAGSEEAPMAVGPK